MVAAVRSLLAPVVIALLVLPFTFDGHSGPPRAASGPVTVAHFDFEDGMGGPDAQGWRPLTRFAQEEAYFHVEDFSGANHEAFALEGGRSMWCGLTAEDPRTCYWNDPPGYGGLWNQNFVSASLAVQGDVTLDFLVDMDLEPGYDFVYVEYEDTAGAWANLDTYNCGQLQVCGPELKSYTVPAAAHGGSTRFRFHFTSDFIGDSEGPIATVFGKAFLVDSLTVSDNGGLVDFQDFESEAVGDSVTTDGDWHAEPNTDAYNGGLLVEGSGVVQESLVQNNSWFWAFYKDSGRDYTCGGFPGQLVVPESRCIVRSPRIDLTHDVFGNPVEGNVDSVEVSFDVYRDLPEADQKRYTWGINSYSETCLLSRRDAFGSGFGTQKDWYRHTVVFVPTPGTVFIEMELGVDNLNFAAQDCRSHAPLIDNVTVTRYGGTVTAAETPVAAASLVLYQNTPNPFNPSTTIRYEVPSGASRVTLRVYDVGGRLVRTLVDGPVTAGPATAVWDGRTRSGEIAASGVYFYELQAGGARETRRMVLLK